MKFKSLDEVKEYLYGGNKIKCLLCGRMFKSLAAHISKAHDIDTEQYKDMFGIPRVFGLLCSDTRDRYSEHGSRLMQLKRDDGTFSDFLQKGADALRSIEKRTLNLSQIQKDNRAAIARKTNEAREYVYSYKEKMCQCGRMEIKAITSRKLCDLCLTENRVESVKRHKKKHNKRMIGDMIKCLDCGEDTPLLGTLTVRCPKCKKEHRKKFMHNVYLKKKHNN